MTSQITYVITKTSKTCFDADGQKLLGAPFTDLQM